jgi:hypothetical protein
VNKVNKSEERKYLSNARISINEEIKEIKRQRPCYQNSFRIVILQLFLNSLIDLKKSFEESYEDKIMKNENILDQEILIKDFLIYSNQNLSKKIKKFIFNKKNQKLLKIMDFYRSTYFKNINSLAEMISQKEPEA